MYSCPYEEYKMNFTENCGYIGDILKCLQGCLGLNISCLTIP